MTLEKITIKSDWNKKSYTFVTGDIQADELLEISLGEACIAAAALDAQMMGSNDEQDEYLLSFIEPTLKLVFIMFKRTGDKTFTLQVNPHDLDDEETTYNIVK